MRELGVAHAVYQQKHVSEACVAALCWHRAAGWPLRGSSLSPSSHNHQHRSATLEQTAPHMHLYDMEYTVLSYQASSSDEFRFHAFPPDLRLRPVSWQL